MRHNVSAARHRTALVDVDGVLITGRTFKTVLSEKYAIHPHMTNDFFTTTFVQCQLGAAELSHELPQALDAWGWRRSVEAFTDEWFQTESTLDHELLRVLASARVDGVRIYLATMQEHLRMEYLLRVLDLDRHVDGAFPTYEVGYPKTDPRYFDEVLRRIGECADSTAFVDDTPLNVDTARSCGLHAVLYRNARQVASLLAPRRKDAVHGLH